MSYGKSLKGEYMENEIMAIYKPGSLHLESISYDGKTVHYTDGQTIKDYMAECPGAVLMPLDEAIEAISKLEDEAYCSGPFHEISEKDFIKALECLPPEKWETVADVNIFRMCEYLTSNITAHYASYQGRYFTANRRTSKSYADISTQVKTSFVAGNEKANS
jgi:hypothetical protein